MKRKLTSVAILAIVMLMVLLSLAGCSTNNNDSVTVGKITMEDGYTADIVKLGSVDEVIKNPNKVYLIERGPYNLLITEKQKSGLLHWENGFLEEYEKNHQSLTVTLNGTTTTYKEGMYPIATYAKGKSLWNEPADKVTQFWSYEYNNDGTATESQYMSAGKYPLAIAYNDSQCWLLDGPNSDNIDVTQYIPLVSNTTNN